MWISKCWKKESALEKSSSQPANQPEWMECWTFRGLRALYHTHTLACNSQTSIWMLFFVPWNFILFPNIFLCLATNKILRKLCILNSCERTSKRAQSFWQNLLTEYSIWMFQTYWMAKCSRFHFSKDYWFIGWHYSFFVLFEISLPKQKIEQINIWHK